MIGGRRAGLLNSKRIWLVMLALLAVPLLVEFNHRLAISRQLFEEEARLQRQIEIERARWVFLQQFQALANSNGYVEWWARVKARMTQPGEIAIVPYSPAGATISGVAPVSSAPVRDTASEWWAVFFASVP